MEEYLISRYNFTEKQAAKIVKEYDLLIANTNSVLDIDDLVKIIQGIVL